MIKLSDFICVYEELTSQESGNNKLIDKTDNYCLYAGNHLYDRLMRHTEDTGNIGDKINIKNVKFIVNLGFHFIEDLSGMQLKVGDPDSAIALYDKRTNLNVVVYIKKIERDTAVYDIIIKTVMTKENFKSSIKRIVRESKINIIEREI